MWIPLHTHSYYSFLKGLVSPFELAKAAAAQAIPALALTDTQILAGAIEFHDACRTLGVRPILGLEAPVRVTREDLIELEPLMTSNLALTDLEIPGNLVLLAENMLGWSNLCRLSSILQTGTNVTDVNASLSLEELSQHTQGLICLTGGRRGFAARFLSEIPEKVILPLFERLNSCFENRIYLELQAWQSPDQPQDQRWGMRLMRISQRLKIPLVASPDIYYLSPEQARLQRVISAIRLNQPIDKLSDRDCALPGSHFMLESELRNALSRFPVDNPQRLIDVTLEVADRCQLELPLGERHYPVMNYPESITPEQVLKERVERAAITLYGDASGAIQERLDHELRTIEICGYASLFLIVEEILDFARRSGVPVSSRGSAASSLVAHCLGITTPDPIRLNLYFERFLNPMRVTPPDIDTDLCSRRRDQVIRYIYDRFGHDRVAMVSTINRFRSRSALRETAKAYGLAPAQVSAMLEKLPYRWYGALGREAPNGSSYSELADEYPGSLYQEIFQDANSIIGLPHHLSIHPGGVVITPGPLTELAPIQLAPKGIVITQFDLTSIERLGLLKIDMLGIRGLTVLGDVAEAIGESGALTNRQNQARWVQKSFVVEVLESIPEDDQATSATIQHARTIGCFQIESPGMRSTLREIQAHSVEDIMIALALYRPGPLSGGLKDTFVERYKARADMNASQTKSTDDYLHPALQPLLKETYGVILYQEQVLRIAHELAGFSLSDADLLRRAMSHFDLDKQMLALKDKFIQGALSKSQVPEMTAERIWELMAAFAGYGFPKAHAASYAVVAWRSAWCKTHYPALFMTAVLANWGGYYSQRVYLTEARRMGLTVRPPHVNYAQKEFSLAYLQDSPVLFMGLGQVRDLTQRTIGRIQSERPFRSFSDFVARVDPRKQEAHNLILAGALEGFGRQPGLLRQLSHGQRRAGQLSLFPDDVFEVDKSDNEQDWSIAEKVAAQEEILGASLVAHPLELAADQINRSGALSTIEAVARIGQQVRVAGMRQTWRRSRTKRGEYIYFMSLEDMEGMVDVIIPNDVYQKYRQEMTGSGPFIIEGLIDLNPSTSEPSLRANRITRLSKAAV